MIQRRFNQRQHFRSLIALLFGLVALLSACKKENPNCYPIPDSYNFENVSYQGQTDRLDMLGEMVALMKSGNEMGTTVDAQVLRDMFANTNAPFTAENLNTSTKQLESKCFITDVELIKSYMDSLAAASGSNQIGSNGVAGVVTSSTDPSKKYLFSANGFEYTQLIEKGLMGAVFYYQIADVYFGEDRIGEGVDNTTVTVGEGTPMEHHWDEAFGYFGVPFDFPANKTGIRYYGSYADGRDAQLGSNSAIMNGFLRGRAAISNDDHEAKKDQRDIVRDELEKVIASTAIHYLNGAKSTLADDALRNHQLSEAIAFTGALKYSPTRKINLTQIDEVLGHIGDNLYNISVADIDAARDLLSTVYGMHGIKSEL